MKRKKFVERAAQSDRERRFPRENVDERVAPGVHALSALGREIALAGPAGA